eukprot:6419416-Amphidinium_carterae.2
MAAKFTAHCQQTSQTQRDLTSATNKGNAAWVLGGQLSGLSREGGSDRSTGAALELHSKVGCACHDGHNALKW